MEGALKIAINFIRYFYPLPVFFFSLSTAATGIAAALLIVFYIFSGCWKNWRVIGKRKWALPLFGLMLWTILGLLWSNDIPAGMKVVEVTVFGIYAFIGATLPWNEESLRIFVRVFFIGIFINAIIAVLKSTDVLIVPYGQPHPFVGLASHIWWSMALTNGLLWFIWDWRHTWAFPRWVIAPMSILLFSVLILSPGRSGQLLFIILIPIAIWIIYSGKWRYWGLGVLLLAAITMSFSPIVQHRAELGMSNLEKFWHNPNSTETSWGIRIATMEAGAVMFVQHPFIGVGTGDFSEQMEILQKKGIVTKTPGIPNSSAANSYLSEAAVLGLPGIILFVWFIWKLSVEAWQSRFMPQGWFVLAYLGIFWIGGLYNTLNWGYVDAMEIALFAGLPLLGNFRSGCET